MKPDKKAWESLAFVGIKLVFSGFFKNKWYNYKCKGKFLGKEKDVIFTKFVKTITLKGGVRHVL